MFKLLGMMIGAAFRFSILSLLAAGVFFFVIGAYTHKTKYRSSRTMVKSIAEDLDSRVTEAGTYIASESDLFEFDAWGTPIEITYTAEGIGEVLTVRSAGPDKTFDTSDDIRAIRKSPNIEKVAKPKKPSKEQIKAQIKAKVKDALHLKVERLKGEVKPAIEHCGDDDDKDFCDK